MLKLTDYAKSFLSCIVYVYVLTGKTAVHLSEINKAKSKWKALLACLSHNPKYLQ